MIKSTPRRALVLTSEAARHRFRASLPPHVLAQLEPVPARLSRDDWRHAIGAFCACFLAVSLFIA